MSGTSSRVPSEIASSECPICVLYVRSITQARIIAVLLRRTSLLLARRVSAPVRRRHAWNRGYYRHGFEATELAEVDHP